MMLEQEKTKTRCSALVLLVPGDGQPLWIATSILMDKRAAEVVVRSVSTCEYRDLSARLSN